MPQRFDRRCLMGPDRAAVTEAAAPTMEKHGSAPGSGPRRVDRNCVRVAKWAPVEDAPEGNGMWIGQLVLAPPRALATRGGLASTPRGAARGIAAARPIGFGACRRRQCVGPRAARGGKTGPNPTDRHKPRSKHHILTEARGIPLTAVLTSANRNDITQLLPLVDGFPPLRGRPGRPRRKPALV
jgi:hypothetical protein